MFTEYLGMALMVQACMTVLIILMTVKSTGDHLGTFKGKEYRFTWYWYPYWISSLGAQAALGLIYWAIFLLD